jgi:Concanavalin A-like lectin/glucanases superfamily
MLGLDFLINFSIGLLRDANPTWTAGYAKVQLIDGARASFPGIPVNAALRQHCTAIWEAAQGSTYEGVIQLDSPLAYFRLDEAAGTAAIDIGGAATDFVYSSDVAGWIPRTPGAVTDNAAVTFDGLTRRILGEVGTPWLPVSSDHYSVEWWVKGTDVTLGDRLIDCRSSTAWHAMVYLADDFSAVRVLRAHRRNNEGTLEGWVDFPAATVLDGGWHHCVMVVDGAQMRGYLDTVLMPTAVTPTGTYPPPNIVGFGGNAFAEANLFVGSMDEIAFYPTSLPLARITAHFDARTLPSP